MFDKKKTTTAYSVEQCILCKKEVKREFREGDYVFAETSQCQNCEGKMQIEKIFGETIEN